MALFRVCPYCNASLDPGEICDCCEHRPNSDRSLENLRTFNTMPPDEQREIARLGGIASGKRRREIADMKHSARIHAAALALVDESREEYRQAIKKYIKDEKRKNRRQKKATLSATNTESGGAERESS